MMCMNVVQCRARWLMVMAVASLFVWGVACQPSQECTQTSDCSTENTCQQNKCKPPPSGSCQSEKDCKAPTPKCDRNTSRCVACIENADCGQDKLCTQGKCESNTQKECTTNDDCKAKSKSVCSDAGKCEWDCRNDADCKSEERCQDNACVAKPECSSDDDCKTKGRFFCSDKGKCDWLCKSDQDCGTNEECKEHKCEKKAMPPCQKDDDCKAREAPKCHAGKCVPCVADSDCGANQTCQQNACTNKPPPTCQPACRQGESCKEGKCVPDATQCTPACKANEQCIAGKCTTKSNIKECNADADCDQGQSCNKSNSVLSRGYCGKTCTADADCGQNAICLSRTCTPTCDSKIAQLHNPACPGWMYCSRGFGGKSDYCRPFTAKRNGPRQYLDACEELSKTPDKLCEAAKGLFCDHHVCMRACDQSKGNADCEPGEICEESRQYSHTGSRCAPQHTQKKGEPCGNNGKGCAQGLYCGGAPSVKCMNGTRNCLTCIDACDPKQGQFNNPKCSNTTFCRAVADADNGGYCAPFGQTRQGPLGEGAACDLTKPPTGYCDAAKGFVCLTGSGFTGTCVKACNPNHGDKDCGTNKVCTVDPGRSHLGGICANQGQKKLYESCKTTAGSELCEPTLRCTRVGSSGPLTCHQPCDPKQANACPNGQTCTGLWNQPNAYVCSWQRDPKRQQGESCLTGGPTEASSHDCAAGLYCSGGTCKTAQKEGQICSVGTCGASMICGVIPRTRRRSRCWSACDPSTNSTCPSGSVCTAIHPAYPARGACMPGCKDSTECKHPGTICQENNKGTKVCH